MKLLAVGRFLYRPHHETDQPRTWRVRRDPYTGLHETYPKTIKVDLEAIRAEWRRQDGT
jgi:hypothetical protein